MTAVFDSVATLKAKGPVTYDDYGNPTSTTTYRLVYVKPRGVYNSEFYNAAQAGLRPTLTLELTNRDDYDGEREVAFEGKDYTVIRVDWASERDAIKLICEEKVNNG